MLLSIGLSKFIEIEQRTAAELWLYIDFQNGGHDVANLLPASGLETTLV